MINDHISVNERVRNEAWYKSEIAKAEKAMASNLDYIESQKRALAKLQKQKMKDFFKRVFKFN